MNQDGGEPEGRGTNLVVMVIVALATFVIPAVQRWLQRRAERGGAAPDSSELYPEFQSDEDESREEQGLPPLVEVDLREPETLAKAPSRRAASPDREPLIQPVGPVPRRPRHALEERLFAGRRRSLGARLILAKEILDRPKWWRRTP